MSRIYPEDASEIEKSVREEEMYHFIMRNGKLDEHGFLIEPPKDMSLEENAYYRRLLKLNRGKIQYVV